jgi:hypothetical protein
MTAPKVPVKRPARVKSLAACGAPPILTGEESSILAAYRAMDDETREFAMETMQILARRNPRGPRLHLVAARST